MQSQDTGAELGLRCVYFCINHYKTASGAVAGPHYLSVQGLPGLLLAVEERPLPTAHLAPTLIKCLNERQNLGYPAPISLVSSQTWGGHFSPKPSASPDKDCQGPW